MNGEGASLLIAGGTLIGGQTDAPIQDQSIWVENQRIKAIGVRDALGVPPTVPVLDARGKYIIPGLMNANVHLLCDVYPETLSRYAGRYEELIAEAAQIALKNGLTTVFDTAGPRRFLMAVRDKINQGVLAGSRIFCAGWIVGLDGPYSEDFLSKARESVSPTLVKRINSIWVENVGRHLMWLTPDAVADQVRAYIGKGIDFVKYASNDHMAGAFLAFSPSVQAAIVGEAHGARITAQAHTLSVEGLKIAIEAECDLIQHANLTGPTAIPEEILELFGRRQTGAVIFPLTERGFEWFENKASEQARTMWAASEVNARNLIRSGARLLLGNDGAVFSPETLAEPSFAEFLAELSGDAGGGLYNLGQGHFGWFRAMEEKGCPPMDMLRAATRNIAEAYGKGKDLGTIEVGKIADILILEKNPLTATENYRSIQHVIKEGVVVDREALPRQSILAKPMEPPAPEEAGYVPFLRPAREFPMCPACMRR